MDNSTTTANTPVSQSEKLLYSQFRRKINAEAARSQIKKLEYDLANVKAGVNVLKSACADANSLELGAVCVLPSFVRNCSVFLGMQRKCGLVACISSPHGGDATPIKVKAVKRAINDGADEVEVTAPVAHIRDGNFSYVKKEFKKLKKAVKHKSLRIDLESNLLSHEEVVRVCNIAADCGVNSIKTGSSALSSGNEIERITEIKSAVKDKCTIKAEGVATVLEMSSAIDMGASVIGSKNAADVARAILTAAETEF
ncbi:MAG: hypothetical protein K2O89_00730 [Clostridia bacterium]|nr:hypothetical protein [Clostridia bacterium]